MKAFRGMKVITGAKNILEAENILDMAETNNGGHTIMIVSIDLGLEVDENHKTLYLYTVYISECQKI